MKKLKMSLMALAAIGSVGGAFAFKSPKGTSLTTYYAIEQSPSSFVWATSIPQGYTCQATALNATCTITTANTPTDNQVPADQTVTNMVYKP